MRVMLLVLVSGALLAQDSHDDFPVSVKLSDGSGVEGYLISFKDRTFKLRVGRNVVEVREDEVREIRLVQSRPPAKGVDPSPAKIVQELLSNAFDAKTWKAEGAELTSSPLRRTLVVAVQGEVTGSIKREAMIPPGAARLVFEGTCDNKKGTFRIRLDKGEWIPAERLAVKGDWVSWGSEIDVSPDCGRVEVELQVESKAPLSVRAQDISLSAVVPSAARLKVDPKSLLEWPSAQVVDTAVASPVSFDEKGNWCYLDYSSHLILRDAKTGEAIRTVPLPAYFLAHREMPIALNPKGDLVACVAKGGRVSIVELSTGKESDRFKTPPDRRLPCVALSWMRRSEVLIAATREAIYILDWSSGKEKKHAFPQRIENVSIVQGSVAWLAMMPTLEASTTVWDMVTRLPMAEPALDFCVDVTRDLKSMAVSFPSMKELMIYENINLDFGALLENNDLGNGSKVKLGLSEEVSMVALSPSGSLMATIGPGTRLAIRSISNEKVLCEGKLLEPVRSMAFVSDQGPLLVRCGKTLLKLEVKP